MLADHRYCYPLSITDYASLYLITCDAFSTTKANVRSTPESSGSGDKIVNDR